MNINFKKALIFDSSSLITLNMINMLDILKKLKDIFNGEFLISEEVYKEIVTIPLGVKKYEIRALNLKKIIDEGIIKTIKNKEINILTDEILKKANNIFSVNNQNIKIIHKGEASCISLYNLLKGKKAMVIDERTTRLLLEKPENLHLLLESKLHTKIKMNEKLAKEFLNMDIKILRSSELLYYALKKDKIDLKNGKKMILDALLYASKAYGCSISDIEIEKLKNTLK